VTKQEPASQRSIFAHKHIQIEKGTVSSIVCPCSLSAGSSLSVFALHPLYLRVQALSDNLPAAIKSEIEAARRTLNNKEVAFLPLLDLTDQGLDRRVLEAES
jgi:hypothetical protein